VFPKVFYTWPQAINGFDDPDFKKKVKWNIPLLDGYAWEAVDNISKNPSSKSWSGIDCPMLVPRIEAFNPDAILIFGWNHKSHFRVMRYFKGKIPVWFRGDSTLLDEQLGIKRILRRVFLSWIYQHIDKAFYVGTNNKIYYKAHGLKENQLQYAPHAVENERFFDSPNRNYSEQAHKWRRSLGFSSDDIVLLFAGKFEPKKDPRILIDAVLQLNSKSNRTSSSKYIQLLLVGNGILESDIKRMSSGTEYIKMLPFQNQLKMPIVYRIADIFCLPSLGPGETWGLAVNEAMACERPVITSDKVGCATDLITNGKNGFIFKAGNIESLKIAIRKIAQYDLHKWSAESHQRIMNYSYNKIADSIEGSFSMLGK